MSTAQPPNHLLQLAAHASYARAQPQLNIAALGRPRRLLWIGDACPIVAYHGQMERQQRGPDRREADEIEQARLDRSAGRPPMIGDATVARALENLPSRRDNTVRWIFALVVVVALVILAAAT